MLSQIELAEVVVLANSDYVSLCLAIELEELYPVFFDPQTLDMRATEDQ